MDSSISSLAELLIEARTEGRAVESVPDDLIPPTMERAQAVDDAVAHMSGWPVLGWKIGCTSIYAQELLGTDGPFAGRVYDVRESGTVLAIDELPSEPLLEGEFAFVLGQGIDPDADPIDRAGLTARVAEIRPAIEVVGGRYASFVGLDVRLLVADAGANGLVVVGEPAVAVDPASLAAAGATMSVDGSRTGAGTGADVLGDPLDALLWLVHHLRARGIGLEAGQLISTGTATQVAPIQSGSTATAEFDLVGSVSLALG